MSRHIVTCLIRNGPLAFVRVAGLCAHRRYAVESIIAIPGADPRVSRIILVIEADQLRIANAVKQLDKLIDVLRVDLQAAASSAACDMLLARVGSAVDEVARRGLESIVGSDPAVPAEGLVVAASG